MSELKACPLCGESPGLVNAPFSAQHYVRCRNCGVEVLGVYNWNTRPLEDDLRAKLDAAEAKIARVRKIHADLLAYPDEPIGGVATSVIWTRHAFRTVAADLGDILDGKETP